MTLPSPSRWMGPGLLLALALLGALIFTRHSGLPSFYDDSVDYLIMARDWTPWCESSSAIREAASPPPTMTTFARCVSATGFSYTIGENDGLPPRRTVGRPTGSEQISQSCSTGGGSVKCCTLEFHP